MLVKLKGALNEERIDPSKVSNFFTNGDYPTQLHVVIDGKTTYIHFSTQAERDAAILELEKLNNDSSPVANP